MKAFRLMLVLVFAMAIALVAVACSEDCPVCETGGENTSGDAPPPGTDVGNVCMQDKCANQPQLQQGCQEFLDNCLQVEDEDECVAGAWFFWCKT